MQSAPANLRILNPISSVQGPDGLPAINTTLLPDGAIVVVGQNNAIYQLRKTSVAAEVVPTIMAPSSPNWPGRWFLYPQSAPSFQNVSVVVPAIPANSGIEVNAFPVAGITDNDDVVVFNLKSSGIVNGLAFTLPRITGPGFMTLHVLNGTGSPFTGDTYDFRVAIFPSP